MLNQHQIKHVLTTPYTPSSNGAVERVNRTISQYLRTTVKNPQSWDVELPHIVLVYNHTMHSETQLTPCEYILKRAHTLTLGLPLPEVEECWTPGHRNFQAYALDQQVGLKLQLPGDLTTNKFKPRYCGPYTITTVNDNQVTYVVKSNKTGRQYRVHHRQLRGGSHHHFTLVVMHILKNMLWRRRG